MIFCAEDNARLLIEIKDSLKANGLGSISNFCEVSPEWICPCCLRMKREIARIDKNGNLLCALHYHHDHFEHYARDQMPALPHQAYELYTRFPRTLICNDCNVAEPVAKRIVGAKSNFSFAPFEIATFIIVESNAPHKIDEQRAMEAYESATHSMRMLWGRIRAARSSMEDDSENIGSFERIGSPINRIIAKIAVVKNEGVK